MRLTWIRSQPSNLLLGGLYPTFYSGWDYRFLGQLRTVYPNIRCIDNNPPNGFGFAVRCGEAAVGKYVAIVMADASDDPDDVVRFFRLAEQEGLDAIFGNRFTK